MIKKFNLIAGLLITVLVSTNLTFAESQADKLIRFHNLELKHELEWSNFHKSKILNSKALKNQIKRDWVNFRNNDIKKLSNINLAQESKEAFFKQKLDDALALHKKHMNKWAILMKKETETARALSEKQFAEIAKFEGKEYKSLIGRAKSYFSRKKILPGQEKVTDAEIEELDVDMPA